MANRYSAKIERRTCVVDENVFSELDVLSKVRVKRNKGSRAFIDWLAADLATVCEGTSISGRERVLPGHSV